ncbi:Phosphotransferase enzyme family protein [Gracilibacillus orientalis]|uniref:Phosphotransferase enzyme family protein n=1 Tax=Gracilibacillus orientalis TaxID=334253 RepID=A0A1I4LKF7_9BACI|nr:aminoglycoside phosphotransferase family protein [Gracilibacillus orientalis]SFL91524.1 Phosphotransferase enzyme family protein [Gracilibacillus orientalis]
MLLKFIVYSKDNKSLLLNQLNQKFFLPAFEFDTFHIAVTSTINHFFMEEFKLKTNVLRCNYQELRIYELEALDDLKNNNKYVWIKISSIPSLKDQVSDDKKELLLNVLNNTFNRSVSWFEPGRQKEMRYWVEQKVFKNGSLTLIQMRSWERAALFKVKTSKTNYYFKAVPKTFAHEALVHRYISGQYPSYVPEIIAINENRNWYIMSEIQGDLLGKSKEIEHWQKAVHRIIDIQKNSYIHKKRLQKLGCPERPLVEVLNNYLEQSLEGLVDSNYISKANYTVLKQSIPSMLSLVHQLDDSYLPKALDHGDLFGGNIIVQNGQPIIYDWSDSSLTHPFLSVVVILEEISEIFSNNQSNSLLESYIKEWEEFDTFEHLLNEYRIIRILAPLYYLTVYQQFIFPNFADNVDKQWVVNDYVDQWLNHIFRLSAFD